MKPPSRAIDRRHNAWSEEDGPLYPTVLDHPTAGIGRANRVNPSRAVLVHPSCPGTDGRCLGIHDLSDVLRRFPN